MKIQCDYCGCSINITDDKCPHCGGANEQAIKYLKEKEAELRKDKDREFEAKEKDKERQYAERKGDKKRKVFLICFGIIMLTLLILRQSIADDKQEIEKQAKIEQQQKEAKEELAQKEAKEKAEKEAYDSIVVKAEGLNNPAEKDKYFSVQINEIAPYELNYDHNIKDWGAGVTNKPLLTDKEHRIAVKIQLISNKDNLDVYGNLCKNLGLYVCDENNNNIHISDTKFLNGSYNDNYYDGGKKISNTEEFINNYIDTLRKNQTMTYWLPLIVMEDNQKLEFHFNYNIVVIIDNPYYK